MAITCEHIAVQYPITACHFIVSPCDEQILFTRALGLDITCDIIEYSGGTVNGYNVSGQRQAINITLSKGVFPVETLLYSGINSVSLIQVKKKDILIGLTNDAGSEVLMSWSVANAFPASLNSSSFDATSNDPDVQELTLMAEQNTFQVA